MFYIVTADLDERTRLIEHLKTKGIYAVFHYLSLHKSPFYTSKYTGGELAQCDRYADCLIRLPLFYELSEQDTAMIINEIRSFYKV